MQTDILYKQLISKLSDLKTSIERFEKHNPPSTAYAEELYKALNEANKLTSAYVILKEQKDVSPDLNLHLKLMNVENSNVNSIKNSETIEQKTEKEITTFTPTEIKEPVFVPIIEPIIELKKEELIVVEELAVVAEKPLEMVVKKDYPKFIININDKFRIINELFLGNSTEYNLAIEQLNSLQSSAEATVYLRELKNIYNWKDESEMVKKITDLVQKRFA